MSVSLTENATDRQVNTLCTPAQRDIITTKRAALGHDAVKVTLKSSVLHPHRHVATMHWHTATGRLQQSVYPHGHLGPVSGLSHIRRHRR